MKRTKPPLCKCGCKKEVTWSKLKKKWNLFIQWHGKKGKKVSKETKKKMSIVAKKRGFFKEYNKTEEHRLKVIKSNQNREVTEETKKKIANSVKGFKHTEETKKKMKMNAPHNCGPDSNNWKGGVHPYPAEWALIKPEIKERDNHKCCLCNNKINLHVHHINEDKQNTHPSNLITLCSKCHHMIHPRGFGIKKITKLTKKKIKIMKYKIKKYIKSLAIIKD